MRKALTVAMRALMDYVVILSSRPLLLPGAWVNLAFSRRPLHLPLRALPSLPRTEVQSR